MHSWTRTGSGMTPRATRLRAWAKWPVSNTSISMRTPSSVIRRAIASSMAGVFVIT